jgi:anaerobic selenocysteine-containing dehydrogenase
MNAADLDRMGVAAGDLVEIRSELDAVIAVAEPTDDLQNGVVSMAHSWGALPGEEDDVRSVGSNTNRLIPTDRHFDPLTGMARQTAIPVSVRRVDEGGRR